MPRPGASAAMNSTAVLEKNAKALTSINVSDPNMTIFFTAEPNANVSLLLMLSQGSPPNKTYSSNSTILSHAGKSHFEQHWYCRSWSHMSFMVHAYDASAIMRWLFFTTGGYRWMITPEMLQQTPGVWYIEASPNSPWVPGLALRISSFMTKCLYWQIDMQRWSTDGCQVSFSCWDEV